MSELTHFKIYGERCSGTCLLEDTILKNFDVTYYLEWSKYGHKHFLGSIDLSDSDNTLFICIIRDPINWLNSFYRTPHCLSHEMSNDPKKFLTQEVISWEQNPDKITGLRGRLIQHSKVKTEYNPFNGEIYKNIFELRHIKNKWMIEELPKLVKHHIFIRYEDLVNDFENTMQKICDKGLKPKESKFVQIDPKKPVRSWMKIKPCDTLKINKEDIPEEYLEYEKKLGYI